jgi:hypothetical protein
VLLFELLALGLAAAGVTAAIGTARSAAARRPDAHRWPRRRAGTSRARQVAHIMPLGISAISTDMRTR